jgi:hypothetical protein
LVEQSIRNRQVIGSSPIVGSIIFVPLSGQNRQRICSAFGSLCACCGGFAAPIGLTLSFLVGVPLSDKNYD